MSLLPLLKTGGEEDSSVLPSHFGIGGGFSPPFPKMGGEEGLCFRKSPELAAYSAADSPEKVRVQNKTEKLRVPALNPFHRNLFSRCLDLLITANAFIISLLCVFANEHLERRK